MSNCRQNISDYNVLVFFYNPAKIFLPENSDTRREQILESWLHVFIIHTEMKILSNNIIKGLDYMSFFSSCTLEFELILSC